MFRISRISLLARLPLYCSEECAKPTNTLLFANFPRNPRKALHLKSKSTAYTPKSAGSALVIGKIVLTMLVAAVKINQSSIVAAFDQTGVPRIIQVPSGAVNS